MHVGIKGYPGWVVPRMGCEGFVQSSRQTSTCWMRGLIGLHHSCEPTGSSGNDQLIREPNEDI